MQRSSENTIAPKRHLETEDDVQELEVSLEEQEISGLDQTQVHQNESITYVYIKANRLNQTSPSLLV